MVHRKERPHTGKKPGSHYHKNSQYNQEGGSVSYLRTYGRAIADWPHAIQEEYHVVLILPLSMSTSMNDRLQEEDKAG